MNSGECSAEQRRRSSSTHVQSVRTIPSSRIQRGSVGTSTGCGCALEALALVVTQARCARMGEAAEEHRLAAAWCTSAPMRAPAGIMTAAVALTSRQARALDAWVQWPPGAGGDASNANSWYKAA